MTKDYKYVSSRDSTESRTPLYKGRLNFVAGLVTGLVLAVAVHFYHVLQRESVAPPATVADEPAAEADEGAHDYDFFKILTEMEIVVPEYEETDAASRPTYILQAGSFRAQRTAGVLQERLKALDLESEVQAVEMNDGSVWYRVRLGPYDSLSRVNNIRLKLRKQGIESLLKQQGALR